jgi:non-ribosomal peptide synthetase component F
MNKILENIFSPSTDNFFIDGEAKYSWEDAERNVTALTHYFKATKVSDTSIIAIDVNKDFYTYSLVLACYANGLAFSPVNFEELNLSSAIPEIFSPHSFLTSRPNINGGTHYFESIQTIINTYQGNPSVDFLYRPEGDRYAYVMQSSGSTGKPKVIPISYRNLHSYLDAVERVANFNLRSIFAQTAALTFDLSIHDMFLCFRNKGALLPFSASIAKFAPRFINEFNVENIMAVPSFYGLMSEAGVSMPFVKNVFLCGEALRSGLAHSVKLMFPSARIFNFYGPTEATVAISYFEVLDANLDATSIVPIGKSLANSRLALSEKGELMLGGDQLFEGYLNGSAENRFQQLGEHKFFRSGDLCRFDGDFYHFLGRVDFQIKYRGYRLELEGIEAVLGNRFGGNFAAIGFNQSLPGNFTNLAIFYDEINLSTTAIFDSLPNNLSGATLIYLADIPRNQSGKIDRKALTRYTN